MKRAALFATLSLVVLAIGTRVAQQLGVFDPPSIHGRAVSAFGPVSIPLDSNSSAFNNA